MNAGPTCGRAWRPKVLTHATCGARPRLPHLNAGQSERIMTERDLLMAARSEWLVRLLYAFQDTSFVYLAMVRL